MKMPACLPASLPALEGHGVDLIPNTVERKGVGEGVGRELERREDGTEVKREAERRRERRDC